MNEFEVITGMFQVPLLRKDLGLQLDFVIDGDGITYSEVLL